MVCRNLKQSLLPIDIVVATRNQHKVKELAKLLVIKGVRLRSLADFPRVKSVAETSKTFDGNAIKKAVAAAKATSCLALADDSGIEVDVLNGRPGVKSARFAGKHGDDSANNEKMLKLLGDLPIRKRRARYQCSLALAAPFGLMALTKGTWSGHIAFGSKGSKGFGYDSIFWVARFKKTVGQLPASVKQRYSHRAVAAKQMQAILNRLVRLLRVNERYPAKDSLTA